MHLRLERLAVGVEPRFRRNVTAVHEHRAGIPVLDLARQEVAPLEQQYPLARGGQGVRQRAAARAAANDDYVIVFSHTTECPGLARAAHHTWRVTPGGNRVTRARIQPARRTWCSVEWFVASYSPGVGLVFTGCRVGGRWRSVSR